MKNSSKIFTEPIAKRFAIGSTILFFMLTILSMAADKNQENYKQLLSDNSVFTLSLYRELSVKDGNIFISTASISSALAMTYAGARGETAEQMKKTLQFSLPDDKLHLAFKSFSKKLNANDKNYELSVANSIWPHIKYKFKDEYISTIKDNYGAELENIDYNDPKTACEIINKWVDKKTKSKINNVLSAPPVSNSTRLILVNAIYFKGIWETKFNKQNTEEADFFKTPQKTVKCQMMTEKIKNIRYFENDWIQIVELPYKGGLSMLIILPRERGNISNIETWLASANFAKIRENLREEDEITVFLPKFKITVMTSLNDYLKTLGMPNAFNEKADFSGMDGTKDLFIEAVVHKAFVDVNEDGTEAAAATAFAFGLTSVKAEDIEFRADHPFIFFICGKEGEILFMGKISDPTQADNNL